MLILLGLFMLTVVFGLWMIVDVTDGAQDPERRSDRSLFILRRVHELPRESVASVRSGRDFAIVRRADGSAVAVVKWGRINPGIVFLRIRPVPAPPNHFVIEVDLPRGAVALLTWWVCLNVAFGLAWVWFGAAVSELLVPASLIVVPMVVYGIAIAAQYDALLARLKES